MTNLWWTGCNGTLLSRCMFLCLIARQACWNVGHSSSTQLAWRAFQLLTTCTGTSVMRKKLYGRKRLPNVPMTRGHNIAALGQKHTAHSIALPVLSKSHSKSCSCIAHQHLRMLLATQTPLWEPYSKLSCLPCEEERPLPMWLCWAAARSCVS